MMTASAAAAAAAAHRMNQASAGELDDELHRLGALDVDGSPLPSLLPAAYAPFPPHCRIR